MTVELLEVVDALAPGRGPSAESSYPRAAHWHEQQHACKAAEPPTPRVSDRRRAHTSVHQRGLGPDGGAHGCGLDIRQPVLWRVSAKQLTGPRG